MYKRAMQGWLKHFDFILLDEICLFAALILGIFLGLQWSGHYNDPNPAGLVVLLMAIDLSIIIAIDSFAEVVHRDFAMEVKYTLRHAFYVLAISAIAIAIRGGNIHYPRGAFGIAFVVYVILSFAVRTLWKRFLRGRKRSRENEKALLIVTDERYAADIARHMKNYSHSIYVVNGLVLIDRDAMGEEIEGIPVVANLSNAADYICRAWIDEVFFYRSSLEEKTQSLMEKCREMALTVHFYIAMQGVGQSKQSIERIAGYEVLTANIYLMNPYDALFKRLFDVAAGLVGSALALLVLAVVGPMIKKASPGPLLFRQERIGENGRKFTMYKIRSMYVDADKRKKELASVNSHDDGMLFKMDFDPRVIGNELLPDGRKKTGIGDFIRRTSLDEFPQFFNVLKGDMSVVGTRPPTVDEWEKYQYHHRARMSIRPGLTGLWQVNNLKDKMSFDDVVQLDTEYISSWSLVKDFRIILKTISVMIKGVKPGSKRKEHK